MSKSGISARLKAYRFQTITALNCAGEGNLKVNAEILVGIIGAVVSTVIPTVTSIVTSSNTRREMRDSVDRVQDVNVKAFEFLSRGQETIQKQIVNLTNLMTPASEEKNNSQEPKIHPDVKSSIAPSPSKEFILGSSEKGLKEG